MIGISYELKDIEKHHLIGNKRKYEMKIIGIILVTVVDVFEMPNDKKIAQI